MKRRHTVMSESSLQRITSNVASLRRGKDYLEVRQTAISRTIKRIERQLEGCDSLEEEQDLAELAENLYSIGSDLEAYRAHLETEIDKMRRGVEMLEALRGKQGRRAFEAYVVEDTEISLQDLAQARNYYDQVIETVRRLKDESPR
jgi:prefoldin subunit 5